jgi:TonB family protein
MYKKFAWLFTALGVFGSVQMQAQDVVVTPAAWFGPADQTPDELPVLISSFKPEFPPELKDTTEIGFGRIELMVDEKGKLRSSRVSATQPRYKRAINDVWSGVNRKWKPARRGGEAVSSDVVIDIVFNPKSASVKGADATPRLLVPARIRVPASKAVPPGLDVPARVEWLTLHVNEKGEVTYLSDAPDDLQDALSKTREQWKFTPARAAGVAKAEDLRVPLIVSPPAIANVTGKKQVPPHVISQREPLYPETMQRSGLRGDVVVEFVIDKAGKVQNPVVVTTLNPAFNQAAIDAILQWRFEPAKIDGVAVNTRVQQAIGFRLPFEWDGGSDGMEVVKKGRQSQLPEELRYDVAPKLHERVPIVYPYALLAERVKGEAQVAYLVDPYGNVSLTKVAKATRPEMGFALQAAVECFSYEPALRNARPTNAAISFEQEFDPFVGLIVSEKDLTALRLEQKHPERILKNTDLDAKLTPVFRRAPVFPQSLSQTDAAAGGSALVEFLVAEDGSVVLPRVISATKPEFGYAAVQAMSLWRFAPPVSKGKPGVLRVRIPIDFRPPTSSGAPASALTKGS